MFSLCDSHGWASRGWPATNVLINGWHTLEGLSSCGELNTVVAAVVIMHWPGGGAQGTEKSKSHYWLGFRTRYIWEFWLILHNTFSAHIGNTPPLFLCIISSLLFFFFFWENTRRLGKYLIVSQWELALGNSHFGVKIENCLQILWEQGLYLLSLDAWEEHLLWQALAGLILPGEPHDKRQWPYSARLSAVRSEKRSFSSSHPSHGAGVDNQEIQNI